MIPLRSISVSVRVTLPPVMNSPHGDSAMLACEVLRVPNLTYAPIGSPPNATDFRLSTPAGSSTTTAAPMESMIVPESRLRPAPTTVTCLLPGVTEP